MSIIKRFFKNEYLIVFIFTSILSIGFTHPLIPRFGDGQIGLGCDYEQFIWNFWWVKEALTNSQFNLFFTPTQYYPTGSTLSFHDLTLHWSLLSVPLQYVLTRVQIFHLFTFLTFPLSAFSQYYLLRKNSFSKSISFMGAVIFAFCTYRLNRFLYGEISLLGTFYIPLAFYHAQIIWSKKGNHTNALLLALFTFLSFTCSLYNGLMNVLIIVFYSIFELISQKRLPIRLILTSTVSLSILLSLILTPMILDTMNNVITTGESETFYAGNIGNNADLSSFIIPDGVHLSKVYYGLKTDLREIYQGYHGNLAEKSTFLGYTLLIALFVFAFKLKKNSRVIKFYVFIAVLFILLSLGPIVFWKGDPILDLKWIYKGLSKLPLISASRTPSRYVLAVVFFLSILLAQLIQNSSFSDKLKKIAPLVITFLFIVEMYPVSFWFNPINQEEEDFYSNINQETGKFQGGILSIPLDYHGGLGNGPHYLYLQTIHEQYVYGGYISRVSNVAWDYFENNPILTSLHHDDYNKKRQATLIGFTDVEIVREFKKLKVSFVSLDKSDPSYTEIYKRLSQIPNFQVLKSLKENVVFKFEP